MGGPVPVAAGRFRGVPPGMVSGAPVSGGSRDVGRANLLRGGLRQPANGPARADARLAEATPRNLGFEQLAGLTRAVKPRDRARIPGSGHLAWPSQWPYRCRMAPLPGRRRGSHARVGGTRGLTWPVGSSMMNTKVCRTGWRNDHPLLHGWRMTTAGTTFWERCPSGGQH